jgi:hypothetical protein
MQVKKYRNFIRERKREVNKLTNNTSFDLVFEKKVDSLLKDQITSLEFESYLENDFYLYLNESYLINESIASKFADSVKSKAKSIFNNLHNKLKETKGFEMIISFLDKVVSGISKFWKFLKKVNAGKILKKLLITLGITSLASYILTQFGAGWVALMGGRMTAGLLGKKIGNKIVKENLNYLMLFEQFNRDNYKLLNLFLNKINVSTNKLNSDLILNFYQSVLDSKQGSKFNQWKDALVEILKLLRNAANSKNETRIKEALIKLKNHLSIDDKGNTKIISDNNLSSYLGKSDGRKFGNLHGEILSILSSYSLIETKAKSEQKPKENTKSQEDKNKEENTKSQEDKNKEENTKSKSDKEDYRSQNKTGDKKTSIWSKIGSGISKFFKILRKLKWAVVIFFGVVFILNLIFFPIFEPILQIAQVSSFGVVLSDGFEETANAISSIPKVDTSGVKLNLDITDNLPSDSEVTKNIQGSIDDIKENIQGNEEIASKEADDIIQKAFLETKSENINISDINDDIFDKIPNKFELESKDINSLKKLADDEVRKIIARSYDSSNIAISGDSNSIYDIKTLEYTNDNGETFYKIIGLKRDELGGSDFDKDGDKWSKVIDDLRGESKSGVLTDRIPIDLSNIDDETFDKIPNKFEFDSNKPIPTLKSEVDGKAINLIRKAMDGKVGSIGGDISNIYDIRTLEYTNDDGETFYKIIGLKRDELGGNDFDKDGDKWSNVMNDIRSQGKYGILKKGIPK